MQNPSQQPNMPEKLEIEDRPSTSILTGLLILGAVICYVVSVKRVEFWLADHCWSVNRINHIIGISQAGGDFLSSVTTVIEKADWANLLLTYGYANLCTFNMIHMGLSVYFFWVFGGHIESRLGNGRYLILLLLGMIVPWWVLQWDAGSAPQITFFGPLFLTCAMLGGYLVLPPVPLNKYRSDIDFQQKNQIFRRKGNADPRAKWIRNPWMFVLVFVVCQAVFHFWCIYGIPDPRTEGQFFAPPVGVDFDTFRLLPTLVALGLGYAVAAWAVRSAGEAYKQGPMVVSAIKRYHELLDLDVQPDEAVRGTARTLGLSYEKTREIIRRNKGKLRIK
jgi:hypothetical protein